MSEKRGFKGIWIPAEIWLSDDLSLFEKVLFVEIHSLDNERGCYASNQYFANFFGISPRQIRTYVSCLKEKGLIEVTIKNRFDRTIRCKGKYAQIPKPDIDKLMEMKKSADFKASEKRGFKGIWIPVEIWLSDDLSLFEKVLFVEIHSLDNERGCYASNQYFADFFGISPRQIRTYVSCLKEKGLIEVTIKNRCERTIRCKGNYAHIPKPDIDQLMEMKESLDLSVYRPRYSKNSTHR